MIRVGVSLYNVAAQCFPMPVGPQPLLLCEGLCFRGADVAGLHASALFVFSLIFAVIIT